MAQTLQQEIASLADEKLRDWLKNGKDVLSEDGIPILKPGTQEPVRRDLTAAEMSVIVKRLGQCGISSLPVAGSPVGDIVAAMKAKGVSFNATTLPPAPPGDDDDP